MSGGVDWQALARSLTLVADDLEAKQYPLTGVLRVAATELVAGGSDVPPEPEPECGCAACGGHVDQPATGRPRKYCDTCSPPKTQEKSTITS